MERTRPKVWAEVLLVGAGYVVYSKIQNSVHGHAATAYRHARDILDWEGAVGLAFEKTVNKAANGVGWLITAMNYFYSTLWIAVTLGVLVWLYVRRPEHYRPARRTLFTTTMLALAGFFLFPLAPPRLMPGYIDTIITHGTWGSFSTGGLASLSNQYAAMPSMHMGWSLWAGLSLYLYARPRWARIAGLLYPPATLTVIIATANHYVLDAVGGAATLAAGYLVQRYGMVAARRLSGSRSKQPLPAGAAADPEMAGTRS
ncbi:phosphatase PAP2 family protein [Actinocorallia longicatena]|uniref:Phosphatase PAP2 family protein n=1 Tax=Actinocorallia longicatena TaxID=111803 RepID=A0ABP6Q8S9_9ACTN